MKKILTLLLFALAMTVSRAQQVSVTATAGTMGPTPYTTLKGAFDAIIAGTHQGAITIGISANTTETASAVLTASGVGSAVYTSVLISPTAANVTISGNVTPLINLNGADNVTIDGRQGQTGSTKNLTISAITGTTNVAVQFINDASSNTLKYTEIKSLNTSTSSGIILFSTTTGTTGNDGNTIDNCNIHSGTTTTANYAANMIYSAGTTAKTNSGNMITNNTIYDFLNSAVSVATFSDTWTIQGNQIYQAAAFTTTERTQNIVNVATGGSYTISSNFIGGGAINCGGSAWNLDFGADNRVTAITYSGGSTGNTISSNTIANYTVRQNTVNETFKGIFVSGASSVTMNGNTIGSATGTANITTTTTTVTGASTHGIYSTSTGTMDITNNNIRSITLTTASANTLAGLFYGIRTTAGTNTITGNNIGSTDAANGSITNNTVQSSFSNTAVTYGISNEGTTAAANIATNTVRNMAYTGASSNVATLVSGIRNTGSSVGVTISGNIVSDLSSTAASTAGTFGATPSVIGINNLSTTTPVSLTSNIVYTIKNANPGAGAYNVCGIRSTGPASGTYEINKNTIHSLSVSNSSTGFMYGIYYVGGTGTLSNNVIRLGLNESGTSVTGNYDIEGIWATSGSASGIYFNSIYIRPFPQLFKNWYLTKNGFKFNGFDSFGSRYFVLI